MTDRVGFIGLGNMGVPMAARLIAAGFTVHGFDQSQAARAQAADIGVRAEASVADVAAACGTVVLMLPTSDIVDAVAGEIATASPRATTLVIDGSSSIPSRTRQLAGRLAGTDIRLLDAPVSGGVLGARAGSLAVMVGGEQQDLEEVRPILAAYGSAVIHVGPVGSGHAAKALNNLLSATTMLATSEAVLAAAGFGIAPERMLAVVNASSGRNGSSEVKIPRFVLPRTFDSGFTAALMDKDVGIADALLRELGQDAPVAAVVRHRWHELTQALDQSDDHTEIVRPLEVKAGIELHAEAE